MPTKREPDRNYVGAKLKGLAGGGNEMNLSDVSTKDLVEELSKREAVQRIDVAPHTQKVEIAVSESGKFPFDKIFEGPQIILRIWD